MPMTKEEQRIACAELQGWHDFNHGGVDWLGIPPDINSASAMYLKIVPNYPHDLNAMHEVEKTLNYTECCDYKIQLEEVLMKDFTLKGSVAGNYNFIWHAASSQRLEAYLRLKGKWKE